MKLRKEQAPIEGSIQLKGADKLEALRLAFQVYNEESVRVEAHLPGQINKEKVKNAATLLMWAAPTRRSQTRREISALRRHVETELYTKYDEKLGVPHYEFRGKDVDHVLGALAFIATTDRDSYAPEQIANFDVAVELAEITLAASSHDEEIASAA
jgi:hypothetical protein